MTLRAQLRRATVVVLSLALTLATCPAAWAQVLSAAGGGSASAGAAGAAGAVGAPATAAPAPDGVAPLQTLTPTAAVLAAPSSNGIPAAAQPAAAAAAAAAAADESSEGIEAAPQRLQYDYDGAAATSDGARAPARELPQAIDLAALSAWRHGRAHSFILSRTEWQRKRAPLPQGVLALLDGRRQQLAYVQAARSALVKRSAELIREIESRPTDDPVVVDVAGVGAGPHDALFFANLQVLRPHAATVIFEASDTMGTFDKMGAGFSVNSGETPNGSGNPFRGAPVQVADMNHQNDEFVGGDTLGHATILAHDFAKSNILFRRPVAGVEEQPEGESWPAPYRLRTPAGKPVYARIVVVGTGMGDPNDSVGDEETQALIQRERQKGRQALEAGDFSTLPGVETVDDMLERATKAAREDTPLRSALRPHMNKRHLIVGAKDGGNIAAEFLAGEAPNTKGLHRWNKLSMVWLGQKAKNFAAFKSGNPQKRRYFPALERIYASGRMSAQDGRLVSIREAGSPSAPEYVATYQADDGQKNELRTDHVVLAIGYKNGMMRLFEGLGADARLEPVTDRLDYLEHKLGPIEAPVAMRVVAGGKRHQIYAIGNGSGIDFGKGIGEEEHTAAIGGFLDALGARTQRAAMIVAQSIPETPSSGQGLRAPWSAPEEPIAALLSAGQSMQATNPAVSLSVPFKMQLGLLLVHEKLSPGRYVIEVGIDDKGVLKIRSGDGRETPLSATRSAALEKTIDLCVQAAASAGVRRVTASVEVRADGMRSVDSVGFER